MSEPGIAIVGDYDPAKESHQATTLALRHAAATLDIQVLANWVPTKMLVGEEGVTRLEQHDAVFLGPGAPYESADGALAAVKFARERGWPFFGT